MGSARDGTSKTVIFFEDAGRSQQDTVKSNRTAGGNTVWVKVNGSRTVVLNSNVAGWIDGAGNTCPNRWADSDNASGLSGPPHLEQVAGNKQILNNTKTPLGGSAATCLWTQNNCGPNDEPFSFHSGIAMSVMCDGSVRPLKETIDALTLKAIVGAMDGINVNLD